MKKTTLAALLALTTISLTIHTSQNAAPSRPTSLVPISSTQQTNFIHDSLNETLLDHRHLLAQGSLGKDFAIMVGTVFYFSDVTAFVANEYLKDARNKVKAALKAKETQKIPNILREFRSNIVLMNNDIQPKL